MCPSSRQQRQLRLHIGVGAIHPAEWGRRRVAKVVGTRGWRYPERWKCLRRRRIPAKVSYGVDSQPTRVETKSQTPVGAGGVVRRRL